MSSTVDLTSEQISIDRIKVEKGREKPDEDVVRQLMESISRVGLLRPIILHRPIIGMGVHLIRGGCRIEACKRLKLRSIAAKVVTGDTPAIRQWLEHVKYDEGIRRDRAA